MTIISKWLPPLIWAGLIFFLSSIEQIVVSQFFIWDFIAKKIAHVLEFTILYLLIFRASQNYLHPFAITIIYAITDELHQGFVPGRTAALYDLGFDLSGANIAAYVLWKLKQIRRTQPKKSAKSSASHSKAPS